MSSFIECVSLWIGHSDDVFASAYFLKEAQSHFALLVLPRSLALWVFVILEFHGHEAHVDVSRGTSIEPDLPETWQVTMINGT